MLGIGKAFCLSLLALALLWNAPDRTVHGSETGPGLEDPGAEARRIDELVQADLRARGLNPNPVVDDATFLRRAYLVAAGRIPSLAETRRFLARRDPGKRGRLIDALVASPGFESMLFNWMADLLRVRTRLNRQISGLPYVSWIKKSIANDKPWDQMVREMLTAEGSAYRRGNGATGYYLRDIGMPLDNMANTARIFLGIRIECAQCHDHPFKDWSQKEFYRLAAFTSGMQFRSTEALDFRDLRRLRADLRKARKESNPRRLRILRNAVLFPLTAGISGGGSGLIRLPKDYQYDDGKPGEPVTANVPFGPQSGLQVSLPRARDKGRRRGRRGKVGRRRGRRTGFPDVRSKEALATWMTSPENPQFTRVIANRMWKLVFGRGLHEPVDDWKVGETGPHEELVLHLEGLMKATHYDLREFLRILLRTKLFQREPVVEAPADEVFPFQGPLFRRLSAEQIWDSVLTLTLDDVDATLQGPESPQVEAIYDHYEKLTGLVANASSADDLIQRIGDDLPLRRRMFGRGRFRGRRGMIRASELPSPAPDGHLLRQFGQSQREEIQASQRESTVPQALQLMNGVVNRVLNPRASALFRALGRAKRSDDKIRLAYLAAFTRRPTQSELALWRAEFRKTPGKAQRDLVWVLLNSDEFVFLQ
ncbi:MAG TPA: DUF1549 domain-containing protein [Planctomycetes bacterium]|nr:DUF1549 domain-containing protein [Planctomycetota bacterium]